MMHNRWITLLAVTALAAGVWTSTAFEARADDHLPSEGTEAEANDEGESLWRLMFEVNKGIDTLVVKPLTTFYTAFTPPPAQKGVHNMVNNLRAPLVFGNDLLQGETERANVTLERALINTTSGFLGWNDKAAEMGIEGHDEDFGQTLGAWGMEDGPYMILPVIGPSNPRDAVGAVVDFLTMPPGVGAVHAMDKRAAMDAELEQVEKTSLDHYAAIRSMYLQNRRYEISNEADPGDSEGGDYPSLAEEDFQR